MIESGKDRAKAKIEIPVTGCARSETCASATLSSKNHELTHLSHLKGLIRSSIDFMNMPAQGLTSHWAWFKAHLL